MSLYSENLVSQSLLAIKFNLYRYSQEWRRRADEAEAEAKEARSEAATAAADQRRLLASLAAAEADADAARVDAERHAAANKENEAGLQKLNAVYP